MEGSVWKGVVGREWCRGEGVVEGGRSGGERVVTLVPHCCLCVLGPRCHTCMLGPHRHLRVLALVTICACWALIVVRTCWCWALVHLLSVVCGLLAGHLWVMVVVAVFALPLSIVLVGACC